MTRRGQADQIAQEAAEVFSAAESGNTATYIMELLDCVHACETALREFSPYTPGAYRDDVIKKNYQRGYYGDSVDDCYFEEPDDVFHPSHYPEGTMDRIEKIVEGLPAREAANLYALLKYAIRAGGKGSVDKDIAKANNYAHRLVYGEWRWQHEQEA
ncbi:DUF3310 domain-containing protein [Adlercreutzia sp. ZJ242]|uniref:DUF3310 domain-containing protein n=1 Tax=Adlercreutzia sp. ZJ242 TaxID=2709409 RepID=UPI0013EA07B9|nr:DUF3310 domain-containing protein [Adlercreutzia sp. ZJ242]